MPDLHISERLRKLLPPLTAEEKKQLKANIKENGMIEPLFYWYDGSRNVVVDGMTRWDIIQSLVDEVDIPYDTVELFFESYEDAEIWILNHQLGRRNLLKPAAIRKIRGELYNRLKNAKTPEKSPSGQFVLTGGNASEEVGKKSGVSGRTIRRDGARLDAMNKLTKAAKAVAEGAKDAEVKALSRLSEGDQDAVARAVRVGQASTIKEAMKMSGVKPPGKPPKPQPPKQYERSALWKQYNKAIGPIARLVDKIANTVNEKHGKSHKAVIQHLSDATNIMMDWMGVER